MKKVLLGLNEIGLLSWYASMILQLDPVKKLDATLTKGILGCTDYK